MEAVCWIDSQSQEAAQAICDQTIPSILAEGQELIQKQCDALAVDGEIIGTGEADFTKGNVAYDFSRDGTSFRLVDVPGIEGNEERFESCIRAAVAKAHLLFYVNGTNKKPEVETAKKIKKYLNRHAQVLPICNVRGKADSYEFDEDRIALESTHKGAVEAREQTEDVLRGVLGDDCLHEAMSLQGMIAFSGLAYTSTGSSSISSARPDLLKDQKSYSRDFVSPDEMRNFSQISKLEQFLDERKDSFKEEIVESNKRKVISLLNENIHLLETYLEEHESITSDVKDEMDQCRKSIDARLDDHAKQYATKRKNLCSSFFTTIEDQLADLVERKFDRKSEIESEAVKILEKEGCSFRKKVEQLQDESMAELSMDVECLVKRLDEDIKRVRFQHDLNKASMDGISLSSALENMKLSGKELRGALFKVGSYTLTGVAAGSFGGLVGNIIGGVLGFIGGVVSAVIDIFSTKGRKIRKMQKAVGENVDEERRKFSKTFSAETDDVLSKIREHIEVSVYSSFDDEYGKMNEVSSIIRKQLGQLEQYRVEIGSCEYGSI